jgi:RNA-directed DNA polymerase
VSLTLSKDPSILRREFLDLETRADVARLLEVDERTLNYILHVRSSNYDEFSIAKKTGAARKIHAPRGGLKILQKKLLQVFSTVYKTKSAVHGFTVDKTILSNAIVHRNRKFVFNIDIEDFFPSINFGRVRGLFMGIPYERNPTVATVLAQICCHLNGLPQGAPTSPIVSNMICAKLDSQLCSLARMNKMSYTRYADDITFSTTKLMFPKAVALTDPVSNQLLVGEELRLIIETDGFRLNSRKIRLQRRDRRQQVTGLTVNVEPNVKKSLVNQVRSMLYSWGANGFVAAQDVFWLRWDRKARRKPNPDFKKVVKGKIDFIGFVTGKDSHAHAKFYWEYCRLDRKFPFRTITATDRACDFVIRETLWVLESEYGEFKQGTGFYVEGLGIVTCRHVLEKTTLAYHWRNPKRRFDIKTVWENEQNDLAIVQIDAKPRAQLGIQRAASSQIGDVITLYGFPDYHQQQTPVVEIGTIKGTRRFDKTEQILISPMIVAGNSGGPVLDSRNRLLGIASRGPNNNAEDADKTMSAVTSVQHLPAKV